MKRALESINEKMRIAVTKRPPLLVDSQAIPRLVAVSKTKPVSAIVEAYECGQRYFGENYIQELEEKSNSPEIIEKCPDIRFHFIGHLQSNKVNRLLKVRNLYMVETIDSVKLADLIDKAIGKHKRGGSASAASSDDDSQQKSNPDQTNIQYYIGDERLKVMIQVNTSGEEQKNGIHPHDAPLLAEHIFRNCKWLHLAGFMTIGKLDGWGEAVNQDFLQMTELRALISKELVLEPHTLELSMGMSNDYEEAICLGSTSVRIGSLIFGSRNVTPK